MHITIPDFNCIPYFDMCSFVLLNLCMFIYPYLVCNLVQHRSEDIYTFYIMYINNILVTNVVSIFSIHLYVFGGHADMTCF